VVLYGAVLHVIVNDIELPECLSLPLLDLRGSEMRLDLKVLAP
jgi:hypothetical protein